MKIPIRVTNLNTLTMKCSITIQNGHEEVATFLIRSQNIG